MWILAIYILIVAISETAIAFLGVTLDRIYPALSLPISLSLFFVVLWLGWVFAVHLTKPKHAKTHKT